MKLKSIIFLLIISTSSTLFAQQKITIEGIVKDSLTGLPLEAATVSSNIGRNNWAITDENGIFKLSSVPPFTLTVKYLGYSSFKILITNENKTNKLSIKLISNNRLEEVVVSGNISQDISKPLLGVSTLSIKTINKMPTPFGENDILKGLQLLPGVSSVGEASNGINVRGGTTDQNLILLDNAPIFNPTHMFGLFSGFPSDGVSSLDLYKGNVPARYGGRAASVLDISLSNPSLDKFRMSGGISVVSEKIKLEIPIIKNKAGLIITGRGSFNDFLLPIFAEKLKNIKAKFGDATAKFYYRIGQKQILTISSYYSYDFFQTELLGSINNINATATQNKYQTNNLTAKWSYAINSKNNIQTILVSSRYKPDILLPELDSKNKIIIKQAIDYDQLKTSYTLSKDKHLVEFGADALKYGIDPGRLLPGTSIDIPAQESPLESGLESGIYVSDEFQIGSKINISAGLRYSRFFNLGPSTVNVYKENESKSELTILESKSFTKNQITKAYGGFEPRFGLNYALTSTTSLKLGYNFSRQYLQQISNTTTPLPSSRWKLSDANIKPQASQLYTVGISNETIDKVYQYGVEAYYRKTENILDYKPGADFLFKKFPEMEVLQGFNKSYGLELSLSKIKGEVSGWVNYTYSRSLNKVNEGTELDQNINFGEFYASNYDRPHAFNASLVIGQGKHHDFSFNFTYSTGRPYTTPQGYVEYKTNTFPFYNYRNNARIPDYHRLDFAWNIYNPKMDPNKRFKGNWAFSVYNLYGRKNAYSIFFRSEGRVLNPYKLVIYGAPIASLAYKFTFE